jgi:hypothetical protein
VGAGPVQYGGWFGLMRDMGVRGLLVYCAVSAARRLIEIKELI